MSIMRYLMVEHYLKSGGVSDASVLRAFSTVPRHEFVSRRLAEDAYQNRELSIAYQQVTLSPLIIATVLQALKFTGDEYILEVGTGSGYLTALLMTVGHYVFSLERILPLAEKAANHLQRLNYHNVDLHIGDGSQGLPDMATFDVIITTAYASKVPAPLALQLQPSGGRMIIPIGNAKHQKLKLIRREANQWYARTLTTITVPPLIGRYGIVPPSVNV